MKFVLIPPYSNVNVTKSAWEYELVNEMQSRGELEGIDIDIAEGYPTECTGEDRGANFAAFISVGAIKNVEKYSEMGIYDAIIMMGELEPGFFATQVISKVPVVYSLHASIHVASLIGERFSIVTGADDQCHIIRRCVQNHGLGHKLVSARSIGYSSTSIFKFTQRYKKGERENVTEGEKIIDNIVSQCVAAIENDRADSLVVGCPAVQIFWEETRHRLNELNYSEIQIVRSFPASIEMAKAMVNMKLMPAPRAYPSESLRAKPEFR